MFIQFSIQNIKQKNKLYLRVEKKKKKAYKEFMKLLQSAFKCLSLFLKVFRHSANRRTK